MKSYWLVTRGHEAVLERREIPLPQPKAGEAVMRVHACGLNRGEIIVGGAVHGGPEKLGGTEASGVIHALGEGVRGWAVGERVMGRVRGAFTEYAILKADQLLRAPERLSWEQAAAIPSSFLTSYEAVVRYGGLRKGDWVIVAGAASGVGVGAIQTAQVLGARTIGTSRSDAKLDRLKAAGLEVAINTRTTPDFAGRIRELTGGAGAQLAVNLVGASVFPELIRALGRDGRLIVVGYVDGTYSAPIDLNTVHVNRLQVIGISNTRLTPDERALATRGFEADILPALADGRITPLVDRVFAFDELPAAKAYMESDAMVGKVIVRVVP